MLRDILSGDDPQIAAFSAVVAHVAPDILVLTEIDYDGGLQALTALADTLADAGQSYPYRFALRPNSGVATGLDMDGNGRTGEPRDAMGYGEFSGDGGMAILSRFPLDVDRAQDLSALIWRDQPWASLPQRDGAPFPSEQVLDILRLSTTGHWRVPVLLPSGGSFDLLVSSATPPVFDGPEDMNGLRNRDELWLWQMVLDGAYGAAPTLFVLAANTNLDPVDGDGFVGAMADFLADPRLIDPLPRSIGGRLAADADQAGQPDLDTADWPDGAPGNLRVSYVLPSATWGAVSGAGVFWPAPDTPDATLLGPDGDAVGPHHLVWVDLVP